MEQKSESRKPTVAELVIMCFGGIMVVLYIMLGTTIIIKIPDIRNSILKSYEIDISENYAKIFGVFLILYGLFRGYKLYQTYFSSSR